MRKQGRTRRKDEDRRSKKKTLKGEKSAQAECHIVSFSCQGVEESSQQSGLNILVFHYFTFSQ